MVLAADRIDDRRVQQGWLGCANCRERFEIREGVADLRFPAALGALVIPLEADPADAAVRRAALLGLGPGHGMVVLLGPAAASAAVLAELMEGIEVVAVEAAPSTHPPQPGISRLVASARLPLADAFTRALATTGEFVDLEEAARVVAPGGRIVVEAAAPATAERLRGAGFHILLDQDGVVVASPATPS